MKTTEFLENLYDYNQQISKRYPTKVKAQNFIIQLSNFLFPTCKEITINSGKIEIQWKQFQLSLLELLLPVKLHVNMDEQEIVEKYFEQIPSLYQQLIEDAKAINEFDPASHSLEEVILAYPGFQAILVYRLAHPLYELGVPILPRLFSEYAHTNTGIDIHPGAKIGNSFFIDHGTGIVIGETTFIGNHVKLYQGVTLGALNVKKSEAKMKRHPTIEDHVIIYSGTTVLGGETTIGHHSVIGGNVWLTKSLEPYSMVYNKSEIRVRKGNERIESPINFVI